MHDNFNDITNGFADNTGWTGVGWTSPWEEVPSSGRATATARAMENGSANTEAHPLERQALRFSGAGSTRMVEEMEMGADRRPTVVITRNNRPKEKTITEKTFKFKLKDDMPSRLSVEEKLKTEKDFKIE